LHLEAAKFLADRIAALRKSDPTASTDVLNLFALGHLGEAAPGPEADKVAQGLGLMVVDKVAGTSEGHVVADLQGWIAAGEFELAVLAYGKEVRGTPGDSPASRFLWSYALLRQAHLKKKHFDRAAKALDGVASPDAATRDHALALAKSVRNVAVCSHCSGEGKVRCTNCHGKKEVRFDCAKCKGVGAVSAGGGLASCASCKGRGFDKLSRCNKCKDGYPECSVCDRKPRNPPELEDVFLATPCGNCGGRGLLFQKVQWPCRSCLGLGQKLTPRADPSKILP
jgi:hypothetical protein